MQNVTLADGTVIRPLATHEERAEAVRLQEDTWGAGFSEKVPAAILLVAEKTDGVAAGAFTPDGRMVGFVFGLTGLRAGVLIHWSDILAVRAEAQGRRLGEAMKRYQRERCTAIGVERMYWTFDPFVARNAHLNLNVLGASVDEFVPDMYGTATGSVLHGALGTDRFVALWALTRAPDPLPADPALLLNAAVMGGAPAEAPGPGDPLSNEPRVVVRIPDDYATLLAGDPAVARAWRASARRAFMHYLHGGYRVSAFVRGGGSDAAYLLSAPR
jgi:predicted GNAT superfamily acetyltransferase